jgi:hypothetical protein
MTDLAVQWVDLNTKIVRTIEVKVEHHSPHSLASSNEQAQCIELQISDVTATATMAVRRWWQCAQHQSSICYKCLQQQRGLARSRSQLHNIAKIAILMLACLVGKGAACRIQDADIGYCDNGIRDDEDYRYGNRVLQQ